MNGFVSFLAPDNFQPLDDERDFDLFNSQVDDLIYAWLRQYIEGYDPGYTFEEVENNIGAISVSDDSIKFQLLNPHTEKYENFRFWINILEDILKESKHLVERTFYDSGDIEDKIFSITPETLAVIHSWLPHILPEKIINVQIVSGKEDMQNSWPGKLYDYLQVYYYWENGEVRNKQLPTLRKWEFKGTKQGIVHIIGLERGRIMQLILRRKK